MNARILIIKMTARLCMQYYSHMCASKSALEILDRVIRRAIRLILINGPNIMDKLL